MNIIVWGEVENNFYEWKAMNKKVWCINVADSHRAGICDFLIEKNADLQLVTGIVRPQRIRQDSKRFINHLEAARGLFELDIDYSHIEKDHNELSNSIVKYFRYSEFIEDQIGIDEALSVANHLVQQVTNVFLTQKPEIVLFFDVPHAAHEVIIYKLCKKYNINIIAFMHVPLFRPRYIPIIDVEKPFEKLLENRKNNDEDLKRLPSLYKDVEGEGIADYYMKHISVGSKSKPKISTIGLVAKSIVNKSNSLFSGESRFKRRLDETLKVGFGGKIQKPPSILGKVFYHIIRYFQQTSYVTSYMNSVVTQKKSKYVIYFLHFQPEWSSYILAEKFTEQEVAIRWLRANLSEDFALCVKEHPNYFSSNFTDTPIRNRNFIDRISSLKGVDLISHDMPASQLIRGSAACATLTGTVGLESIIQKVPCILLGKIYYSHLDGVIDCSDKSSKELNHDVLTAARDLISDDQITDFLRAIIKYSYPGDLRSGNKVLPSADQCIYLHALLEKTCGRTIV